MTREPIGSIKCPLCGRPAELHRSESRPKLNPDQATAAASYPPKLFVVCPPTSGYRGCGTILANGALAQMRLLELGRVFGPDGQPSDSPPRAAGAGTDNNNAAPASPSPAKPAPPAAAPKKFNPFPF